MLAHLMNVTRQPVYDVAYPGEKAHLRVNPVQAASGNGGPRGARKKESGCAQADFEIEGWPGVGRMCAEEGGPHGGTHKEDVTLA